MLEDEVRIEEDRLDLRQQRVILVDVAPARLDHPDLRVRREIRKRLLQEIRWRDEIGVEDGHVRGRRLLEPGLQRTRFVAAAVDAVQIADIEPACRVPTNGKLGNL